MPESQTLPSSRVSDVLQQVDELAGLPPAEYYAQLLPLMNAAIGAPTGRIWVVDGERLELGAQIGDASEPTDLEAAALLEVLEVMTPRILWMETPSQEGATCCLLAPFTDREHCFAIATIDDVAEEAMTAEVDLAILTAITERVGKTQIVNDLSHVIRAQAVIDGVGRYLDVKPMAYNVVNRLRDYWQVDRVSLAVKRGSQCQVKAISNQAAFDRRSNIVRQQEKLAARVALTEEPFFYPQEERRVPSALRALAEDYFELADSASIALLPVFGARKRRDDPEDIAATIQTDEEQQECVGVVIVEGIEQPVDQQPLIERWRRVKTAVSDAVANGRKYDGLWLMPLWRSLGSFADLFRGHTQRKALLTTGIVAAAVLSLILIPGDFKIRGEGVVQPVVRQHVYAEVEGTIDELLVQEGDEVEQAGLLMSLRNPELAARVSEVAGKLREAEANQRMLTLQRVSQSFESEQEERDSLRTASSVEARVDGLREQLKVLRRIQEQLKIKAPISGRVITWDVLQRLRDRPVKPGQRLLTIAVPSKGWEIELRIPDKRVGYLLRIWEEHAASRQTITTSFVLTSDVSKVYYGEVTEVSPSSNVDDKENENVVRVKVRLAEDALAAMSNAKPGTSVIGHVHCGTASLGYCKLYEFFDWSQRMWFRIVG